jgi:rSAM/selenodomain-associated transferase 1
MYHRRAIAIFAKRPSVGQVKTRLIPVLGSAGATDLARSFLLDAVKLARQLEGTDVIVFYSPHDQQPAFRELVGSSAELMPQNGNDLGARMSNAFNDLSLRGYEFAALIGTDLPTLPLNRLKSALDTTRPVVLGPSLDGGYYLIGLRKLHMELLEHIEWSTTKVLGQTLDRVGALGLDVECLEPWYDVDTPDDLNLLISHLRLLIASGKADLPRHTVDLLRQMGFLS